MNKFNQKGIIPVIVVIITFLIIGGAAIVIQKEVKKQEVGKNINSQTKKFQTTKETTSQSKDAKTQQTQTELSKDAFISEPKQGIAEPGFSFNSPSGWVKVEVSGDNKVAFEAPSEDRITIDIDNPKIQDIWLWAKARVNINIAKAKTADLGAEISTTKADFVKEGISLDKWEQAKLNGEDAFYFEGTEKLEGTKAVNQIKAQLKSEAEEKIGKGALSKEIESKIDKLISDFVRKYSGYILYKDGYVIIISGNALRNFWDKREGQLSASFQTFKILAASEKAVSRSKP